MEIRKLTLLLAALAGAQQPRPVLPFAEATPDIVSRGQTTRITVKGRDLASLQSIRFQPPDGLRIGSIVPLGNVSVALEVIASEDAAVGERKIVLTTPAVISRTPVTRGEGPPNAQLEAFAQSVSGGQTVSSDDSSIYVNSHAITVSNVSVAPQGPLRLIRFRGADPAGDFAISPPRRPTADGIEILTPPDWIVSEARCGADIYDSPITQAVVANREGANAVIVAQLSMEHLAETGPCELRFRLRDSAGNTSPMVATKLR